MARRAEFRKGFAMAGAKAQFLSRSYRTTKVHALIRTRSPSNIVVVTSDGGGYKGLAPPCRQSVLFDLVKSHNHCRISERGLCTRTEADSNAHHAQRDI